MESHSILCSHAQISFECRWRKKGWTCRSASLQPLPHEFRNHVEALKAGPGAKHLWCPQCKYQDAEIQLDPNVFCANTLRTLPYWKCVGANHKIFRNTWWRILRFQSDEQKPLDQSSQGAGPCCIGGHLGYLPAAARKRSQGSFVWSTLLVAFRKQEMLPTWETMALQSSGWNGGF